MENKLNKKQFDILVFLSECENAQSQRAIAQATSMSVGTVNKYLADFENCGLVKDGKLTDKGLEALEPYRVKRAIYMAAGFGSRMMPITLNTPKPLVRVKGQRIIDSTLDALTKAGIDEIILVRGYLAEQFDQLLYKYPNIKFIDNPVYNETNNISSVEIVCDKLQNAYVLEADLLLYNPKIITKYQYSSNFLGVPVDRTDDWCFITDQNGYIRKHGIGGVNCHCEVGISFWTAEDGKKLEKHIRETFRAPGGKEKFWEQVPLTEFNSSYNVSVRECKREDIVEIDTFNELKQLDPNYAI